MEVKAVQLSRLRLNEPFESFVYRGCHEKSGAAIDGGEFAEFRDQLGGHYERGFDRRSKKFGDLLATGKPLALGHLARYLAAIYEDTIASGPFAFRPDVAKEFKQVPERVFSGSDYTDEFGLYDGCRLMLHTKRQFYSRIDRK